MEIKKFNTEPKLNEFERYETHFMIQYHHVVNGYMKHIRLGEFDSEEACMKVFNQIVNACREAGMDVTENDEFSVEVNGTGTKFERDSRNPKARAIRTQIEVNGTIDCGGFDCIVNRPVKRVLNNNLGITIKY